MKELNNIISMATARMEPRFFHLPIHGGDPIFRERVYCYELYHQMRLLWPPQGCRYTLNGEVDKRAHPTLRKLGADGSIPDFLVHVPGDMEGNHAIIEVKTTNLNVNDSFKDLTKLSMFLSIVGYQRGIYLVYGQDADRANGIIDAARRAITTPFAPIDIWCHAAPGIAAGYIRTLA